MHSGGVGQRGYTRNKGTHTPGCPSDGKDASSQGQARETREGISTQGSRSKAKRVRSEGRQRFVRVKRRAD